MTNPIRRALISVYDKTGLRELAQGLHEAGVTIVSTGSTAATISDAGVPVTEVADVIEFPEILDGRVKTLHPRVHAGILADRRLDSHRQQLEELNIEAFDLVVVNLYPFQDTVASGASYDDCIEKIDIGGPSMVRGAAKNHGSVAVVVNPAHYEDVIAAAKGEGYTFEQRRALAVEAYRHTAEYDVAVATWLGAQAHGEAANPEWLGMTYQRSNVLRYGENPHQAAAVYTAPGGPAGLAGATQLHGKDMSYNNYTDADAAWRAVSDHGDAPTVAIIKHANPCGIAVSHESIAAAHRAAHACDPMSAFGGVIAVNRPVSVEMATQVADIFTEVIVAPGYEEGALEIMQQKKNIRILQVDDAPSAPVEYRQISGGLLAQAPDRVDAPGDDSSTWTLAAGEPADEATLKDLEFAWRAARAVKSNAIVIAHNEATVGVGMGQVNRVDAAKLAVVRANTLSADGEQRAQGAVAASDAFFPFADGFEVLSEAGVRAVVQPGGSVRDAEVIEAANKAGVTMYLTGERHFAH